MVWLSWTDGPIHAVGSTGATIPWIRPGTRFLAPEPRDYENFFERFGGLYRLGSARAAIRSGQSPAFTEHDRQSTSLTVPFAGLCDSNVAATPLGLSTTSAVGPLT
jgi:hypothetical protein